MSRKKKPDTVSGVIIINKPAGLTSHTVVQIMRRLYDMPRVGHTGTLDPMATGVLPVLLGRAVKASEYIMSEEKEYVAEMRLGLTTDTLDTDGAVLSRCDRLPAEAEVIAAAQRFTGVIMQTPPMYSALKIGGEKLVDIARRGETIERRPREVTVKKLAVTAVSPDTYRLEITCSKGTYVRSLCHDIGQLLGCGAVMSALVRTRSGSFTLEDAVTPEELEALSFEERIALPRPAESLFSELLRVDIGDFFTRLIYGGTFLYQKKLGVSVAPPSLVRICHNGEFIALARAEETDEGLILKPEKLFKL